MLRNDNMEMRIQANLAYFLIKIATPLAQVTHCYVE